MITARSLGVGSTVRFAYLHIVSKSHYEDVVPKTFLLTDKGVPLHQIFTVKVD